VSWEELKQRWPRGTRVRLNKRQAIETGLFRKRKHLSKYRYGEVVGWCRSYTGCLYVQWDHRKARDIIHESFLKRASRSERR